MTDTLNLALNVARARRNAARQNLHTAHAACHFAQAQLVQLTGYGQETRLRWGLQTGAKVQPQVLHHYDAFMTRLEHAVQLQSAALHAQRQRVVHAEHALQAAEQRLKSVHKVLEQRQHKRLREQQRREQKIIDDRALWHQKAAKN